MGTQLFRYYSDDDEYLIYDTRANHPVLDTHAVRAICSRNCGAGAKGILAGPVMHGSQSSMLFYLPDGTLAQSDEQANALSRRFLQDMGYATEETDASAHCRMRRTGTVFLSDSFVEENMVC